MSDLIWHEPTSVRLRAGWGIPGADGRQTETVYGANVALDGVFVYIDPDPVNPDGPVHALPAEAIRHVEFPPSVKQRRPSSREGTAGQ